MSLARDRWLVVGPESVHTHGRVHGDGATIEDARALAKACGLPRAYLVRVAQVIEYLPELGES